MLPVSDPASDNSGAARTTGPEAEYRAFLEAGRFMIQRAPDGTHVFYPRVVAPRTGAALEWIEASGRGTVYSLTVNRSRDGAYNIALIDLDEGPRMLSSVEGAEALPIGAAVRARIKQGDDGPFVVFDPAGAVA